MLVLFSIGAVVGGIIYFSNAALVHANNASVESKPATLKQLVFFWGIVMLMLFSAFSMNVSLLSLLD